MEDFGGDLAYPHDDHSSVSTDGSAWVFLCRTDDGRWQWYANEYGDGPNPRREATDAEVIETLLAAWRFEQEESRNNRRYTDLGKKVAEVLPGALKAAKQG